MKLSFFITTLLFVTATSSSHGAIFNAISGKAIQVTQAEEEIVLDLTNSTVNQEGNIVIFDNGISSAFNKNGDYLFDMTLNGADHPQNIAILITSGFANTITTFHGKLTGDGHFQHNTPAIRNPTYSFTGDVSEYTGNFYMSGSDSCLLSFGNNTQSSGNADHILGTGDIVGGSIDTTTGTVSLKNRINVEFHYSNAVTAVNNFNNTTISNNGAGSLTLTGTLENTNIQGGNGQIIIHRDATISGDTSLRNGTVAIDKNSTSGSGTITLNSTKITSNDTGRASLNNSIIVTGSSSILSIDLHESNVTISSNSNLTLEDTVITNSAITMNGSIVLSYTNFVPDSVPHGNEQIFSIEQSFLAGGTLESSEKGGLFILTIDTDVMCLLKKQGYDSLSLSVTDGLTSISGSYLFDFADELQGYGLTINQDDFTTTGKVSIGNIQNSSLPVPEPGTFVLGLIGALSFATRRKR